MSNSCNRCLKFIILAVLALPLVPQRTALAADDSEKELSPIAIYFDESELVEVATRSPKPISQVAENVGLVTAEEIERMHAHTVNEVLNRVGGVFVAGYGQDFGGSSPFVYILGARDYHTLVLLDGVRLNNASGGNSYFNFIPISIVKRIEIIKGPASATWGSALGGVVNIITKDPGNTTIPKGSVTATYGEAASRELAGEAFGAVGIASYYLHAGTMESDGLKFDRFFDRDSAYGKFRFALPGQASLTFAGGYSDPHFRMLNWSDTWAVVGLDSYEVQRIRHFWGTAYLDLPLAQRWNLHLALQRYNQDFLNDFCSLGTGVYGGPQGTDLYSEDWKEHTTSGEGRLSWRGEALTVNLGAETSRSILDYRDNSLGIPSLSWDPFQDIVEPAGKEERRGIYTNATWIVGDFTVSPGLRYDYSSTSQEFVSPSLGLTWKVGDDTLVRASVARGFSTPYLATYLYSNNPDLKPESIWSYQAGFETGLLSLVNLKVTAFHQEVDDAWEVSEVPWTNQGSACWDGVDLEVRSDEYKGFSATANFSYILEDSVIIKDGSPLDVNNDKLYGGNLIFDYIHRQYNVTAQLAGHYAHWNKFIKGDSPRDDSWLWDATLGKTFVLPRFQSEVFASVHNLTNASQYWDYEYANPGRWVEAGVKVNF